MTCVQCNEKSEKTLYDKTVARRVATASRRTKRSLAALAVMGLFVGGSAASLQPAVAASDFAGFTTFAQATPLRVEIYEAAIPIPASPQIEFNFSYTKVAGATGPIGTARASAMWPGDGVGEGLKTFGEQLGLPGQLTDGGYPAQVNAQSPGDTATASQEFLPGSVGRVSTSDKKAVAKVGYGTTGDVTEGGTNGDAKPPNLLDILQGDPTALAGLLLGTATGKPGDAAPSSSPLGALGVIVAAGGMESISTTTYEADADRVVATATARLGSVALLAGLVKLDGVEVVTKTTSNVTGGAKTTKSITIGAMTVAGNKFGYTGTGFEAMGNQTPIPGLPDDPVKALAALGIKFEMGKSVASKDGAVGAISAEGLRISIDTTPLTALLPKLPLADLVNGLPDLPGQAAILKGLIVALGEAHPRIDLVLGSAITNAQTVKALPFPETPTTPTDTPEAPVVAPLAPTDATGSIVDPGAPEATPPVVNPLPPVTNVADIPGLPPLGSIPMALIVGGLLLASALGWYITTAGNLLFGGAAACAHGLKAGIPDLRKV
ncbi:MAG: hypothetical protein NTV23_07885 [Propionibacteriales bacterium]|nr:hypothetical protein [Propionibacteriales bacterium]